MKILSGAFLSAVVLTTFSESQAALKSQVLFETEKTSCAVLQSAVSENAKIAVAGPVGEQQYYASADSCRTSPSPFSQPVSGPAYVKTSDTDACLVGFICYLGGN